MATRDVRLSFGAMFIGCVISVSFSGIAALQAYYYFRQYRKRDTSNLRAIVLGVWILDIVHTVFICQGVWHYLVLNWGNVNELDHLTWTVAGSIAVTGLITFVVQMFFANRVWRLSKHKSTVTIVITILAIIRLGSAITTTVQMIRLERFSLFIKEFRWLFTFGLALSSVIDLLITGALCYYLQGNRTGYSSIDDVLHRLLLYTINNGLLTTFASLLAMVFAAAMPHNFLFLSLHFIVAKSYINSLLATLNSRDALKNRDDSHPMAVHISVDGPDSNPRFLRHPLSDTRSPGSSKDLHCSDKLPMTSLSIDPTTTVDSVQVHVNVEQTIHRDDDDTSPPESIKGHYLSSKNDLESN